MKGLGPIHFLDAALRKLAFDDVAKPFQARLLGDPVEDSSLDWGGDRVDRQAEMHRTRGPK